MFARRTLPLLAAAAPAGVEKRSKMQTLHKILTGEIAFKNKALVKECNVELMFGAGWKKELETYAAKLGAEEKKTVQRQVARLSLTRYTTRELAQFGGNGADGVDAAAQSFMLTEGVRMLKEKGDNQFVEYVKAEAKNANWPQDVTDRFIANVKAAKA